MFIFFRRWAAGANLIDTHPDPATTAAPYVRVRLVVKLLTFAALMLGALIALVPIALLVFSPLLPEAVAAILFNGILAAATLAAAWFCLRVFDGSSLRAIGIGLDRPWWRHLWVGASAGMLMVGVCWGVFVLFGWALWQVNGDFVGAAPALLAGWGFCLTVAGVEELLCRGYPFQLLARWKLPVGVILSGLFFASLHLTNAGAMAAGPIVNLMTVHVLFVMLYLRTRSLWPPIGLHAGWNFAVGYLFGMPVSGEPAGSPLVRTQVAPNLWTGYEFGPEGGLVVTVVLVVAIAVSWAGVRQCRPAPDFLAGLSAADSPSAAPPEPGQRAWIASPPSP